MSSADSTRWTAVAPRALAWIAGCEFKGRRYISRRIVLTLVELFRFVQAVVLAGILRSQGGGRTGGQNACNRDRLLGATAPEGTPLPVSGQSHAVFSSPPSAIFSRHATPGSLTGQTTSCEPMTSSKSLPRCISLARSRCIPRRCRRRPWSLPDHSCCRRRCRCASLPRMRPWRVLRRRRPRWSSSAKVS